VRCDRVLTHEAKGDILSSQYCIAARESYRRYSQ
jgi:hypothetical protein